MSESIQNPSPIENALTLSLEGGPVAVSTDPNAVDQTLKNAVEAMLYSTGTLGEAMPAQRLNMDLLPIETADDEPVLLLVTKGSGVLEAVKGKDGYTHQVGPGSLIAMTGSPKIKKATWMRVLPGSSEPVVGHIIMSKKSTDANRHRQDTELTIGARGRQNAEREFKRQAEKRAKYLGSSALSH